MPQELLDKSNEEDQRLWDAYEKRTIKYMNKQEIDTIDLGSIRTKRNSFSIDRRKR